MKTANQRTIDEIFEDTPLIESVLQKAVRDALRIHKLLKNPIATWRDGRVVWIPPEEIPVSETDEENSPPQLPIP